MAIISEGFEYDIFISYSQNDNKYDGWVKQFVANLNKELEATIKSRINIYFDENPHSGLPGTPNFENILNNKLKSIIFIPILSRTYCDINSYTWQHEFLSFNKMIKEARHSKEVKLRNGNITGRILPVRIHNLDTEDLKMLQDKLVGQLKSIDFIYMEPGVNRPLRPEDKEEKNLNKTRYRNQINKVANLIKEILVNIQYPNKLNLPSSEPNLPEVTSGSKSIAVLPFVNMSNDPEQEYLSDGISEEIINTLVQIQGLKVAGRTSAFSFKNTNEDLRTIGEKLNVNTILEGSVRKSGNRIRVIAQLNEASTGSHLWSQKFDSELSDVFSIQDEIARMIVDRLQLTLEEKAFEPNLRPQTQNVEAYQLYLKGKSFFYRRGVYMFKGIQYFEDALKIDPYYALALSGLADSYIMLCTSSYITPEVARPKAMAAADKALQLGNELPEVHCTVATIALLFEYDWARAETEYLLAIELNPHYLQARIFYAIFFLQVVRMEDGEALKQARLAVEYDPFSSYAQAILGFISSKAGYYDEAIAACKKSVEFDKESFIARYCLGYSYHCAGDLIPAIEAYNQALYISARHNWALTSLLALLSDSPEYKEAPEIDLIFKELLAKAKTAYVSPFLLAMAFAAVGKNEEAIIHLKQALDRHDPLVTHMLQGRPDNKALRALPEFMPLMQSIGLK